MYTLNRINLPSKPLSKMSQSSWATRLLTSWCSTLLEHWGAGHRIPLDTPTANHLQSTAYPCVHTVKKGKFGRDLVQNPSKGMLSFMYVWFNIGSFPQIWENCSIGFCYLYLPNFLTGSAGIFPDFFHIGNGKPKNFWS